MYKNFFMGIAAIAALTLVSCSSDDLNSLSDNSSKNEAISFDGYLGRSAVAVNGSRGSVLEIADLKKLKDGFGVFGNYNATGGGRTLVLICSTMRRYIILLRNLQSGHMTILSIGQQKVILISWRMLHMQTKQR